MGLGFVECRAGAGACAMTPCSGLIFIRGTARVPTLQWLRLFLPNGRVASPLATESVNATSTAAWGTSSPTRFLRQGSAKSRAPVLR